MNLGILVRNLQDEEIAKPLLESINKTNLSVGCFVLEIKTPKIECNLPIFHSNEIWGVDFPIIPTCTQSAYNMINSPGAPSKYLYLWDMEWVKLKQKWFSELRYIYTNPNLKIIARSKNIETAVTNFFGSSVIGIVDNFDIDKIYEVIKNDK